MLNSNTYRDNKFRGDSYEAFIAQHYRDLGCRVIENGKEQGLKDGGIDIIAKMGNELYLIQCKDWNVNHSYKITHKDIKVLLTDANDFLAENPDLKSYDIKLRYTLSGDFLHSSAKKYIEECNGDVSYEIIEPPYRKKREAAEEEVEKTSLKKRKKTGIKIVIGFVATLAMLALFILKYDNPDSTAITGVKHIKDMQITADKTPIQKHEVKRNSPALPHNTSTKNTIHIDMKKKEHTAQKKQMVKKHTSTPPPTRSERDQAKANLLMQMQN